MLQSPERAKSIFNANFNQSFNLVKIQNLDKVTKN